VSENSAVARGKVGTTSGFAGFSAVASRHINRLAIAIRRKKLSSGSSCESQVSFFTLYDFLSLILELRFLDGGKDTTSAFHQTP
jgi:hypothetical protein